MLTDPVTIPPVRLFGRAIEYRWAVAMAYVAGIFLDILDTTIVNVALPSLATEFRTDGVEWVVLGYTISLAVWIPASGWLGDRFGTKRVFVTALVAFIGGSALCGMAQSLGQLIAFRVVQGVGGGMLMPVGVAMLFRAFPPAERAKAATVTMIPTLVAPALGPIAGGWLVETFGWRWIFLVNLPLGILTVLFAVKVLREHREPTAGRFDVAGFVTSGLALSLIVFALSEGPRAGWTSGKVLVAGIIGVASAVAMVIVETRIDQPMLALRLLKDRMFGACSTLALFSMASFLGMVFLAPLFLQNLRGFSPFHSGLATFPQAFGVLISSQIAGRLYNRVGPRRLISGGLFAATVANAAFLILDETSSAWPVRFLFFARGLCMGFAFVPIQAASYATISGVDNGRASSIFSTVRQVSISLGIAVLATVLSRYTPVGQPVTDVARALRGFHVGYVVVAAMSLTAGLLALRIHDSDAVGTMRARETAVGRA